MILHIVFLCTSILIELSILFSIRYFMNENDQIGVSVLISYLSPLSYSSKLFHVMFEEGGVGD